MTEVANGTPPLAPNGPSSISVTNGVNGTDHSNGTNGVDQAAKFLDGLIYPPPDIRSTFILLAIRVPVLLLLMKLYLIGIIDKTAALIAKHPNPQSIETKIQGRAATDTRFAFANTNDAYHAYYQHQIQEYKETGGPTTDGQLTDVKIDEATKEKDEDEGKPKGARPPEYEFLAETPAANSVDL
jgi:splicing factor 3A subunit 1